jgi:ABC-type multidrug transport system ATPase subunit
LRQGAADLGKAEDAALIRTKIGVCPQHNTALQDDLTCRETLRLFAHLKGGIVMEDEQNVSEAVEAEVEQLLQDVQFTSEDDGDKEVGTYSGGMKRKVLIAVALLGDPEVVFLDGKYHVADVLLWPCILF